MSRRVALVANPRSGTGVETSEIEELLTRNGAAVERFELDDAQAAARSGAERVAIAGGDGSIGTAAAAAAASGVTLAVIPTGTANDFARALGLPVELEPACALAAGEGPTRRIELGRLDGRPFVNVASAGLAVAAAREAKRWKRVLGPVAYALGALRAGMSAGPLECRVSCDGQELFAGPAWQVIVTCSGAFGGGSSVEEASPSDGRLDATVIEAGSRARLVVHAYGLRFGRIVAQRGVHHTRAVSVDVTVPAGTAFNVDGELTERGNARFEIEPAAVELLIPA